MKFRGYDKLYTTPVLHQFFDHVLPLIDNLAQQKVILYAFRRTFGFGKLVDRISYSQFMQGIRTRAGSTSTTLSLCYPQSCRGYPKR